MIKTEGRWRLSERLTHHAKTAPDHVFVRLVGVDGAPAETYGETYEAATRWAGMVRELGAVPGEFVATMVSEPRTALHSWLGINAARAIEVPIHTEYRGSYLAHVLNTTGAKIMIVALPYLERFEQIASQVPALERLVVVGAEPAPDLPWTISTTDELLPGAPQIDESDRARDRDICCVLFTSGTTGPSKGVLMPFAHLRGTVEGAWPVGDLTADDRYYSMLPFHHVGGKVAVGAMLQAGGQLVLRERFKTSAFWSDVRTAGVTCTAMVGSMTSFLMGEPERRDDRDHTLRKVLLLPLPQHLDEFRERFGVQASTVYNQTETSSPIQSDGYDTGDYRVTGRPRPGVECRIVDEDDGEVPDGEVGELVIRTEEPWSMMAGYLGMPDKTAEAWRNLWLHTGDAFRRDEDGNYYFVDRLKDAIRRRGENISSAELEASVCEFPAVAECAAVGVNSEYDEEEVKVCIVAKAGVAVDPAALVDFLRERVPRFMVPRYVEVLSELPRTPTEKIRKAELREHGITANTWESRSGGH